jgi:filamentous hemagglutinin
VRGRVATRINVSNDGFLHVVQQHFNALKAATKSQFTISQEELRTLLTAKSTVATPVYKLADSGNFVRTVTADRVVGTALGEGPTSVFTVITDEYGNLQTAFPGKLPNVRG